MANSRGLDRAYRAEDAIATAIAKVHSQLDANSPPDRDLLASLVQLVESLDVIQERIRIHHGKPLPGTAKPKAKAKARHQGNANPAPPKPTVQPSSDSETRSER